MFLKLVDISSTEGGKNTSPPVSSASCVSALSPDPRLGVQLVLMVQMMVSARSAHLNGVVRICTALVIVSVRDQDHRLADGLRVARRDQLVAAGRVDGVEERRAAAGTQLVDAGLQGVDIVGPVLGRSSGVTSKPITKARSLLALSICRETRSRTAARTRSASGSRCWRR